MSVFLEMAKSKSQGQTVNCGFWCPPFSEKASSRRGRLHFAQEKPEKPFFFWADVAPFTVGAQSPTSDMTLLDSDGFFISHQGHP